MTDPSIKLQLDQKKLSEICLSGTVDEQINLIQSHINDIKAELSEPDQNYLDQWEAELAALLNQIKS